jgi:hypothetical protein
MAKATISRFSVPNLDELPADIRERIETVREKTGFVPNVSWRSPVAPTSFAPSLPTMMR